jgi:hypothetical protein
MEELRMASDTGIPKSFHIVNISYFRRTFEKAKPKKDEP